MRRATRVVAAALGAFAGFGGPEHGYFEILRGNTRPEGLMIEAMGPPCDPEQVWNLCEPAMTVIPSFLVTGVVATILGLVTMVWAVGFVHTRRGGPVLILLSVALLLAGGGLFPPVIGMVAGAFATRINAPVSRPAGSVTRFLAALWPWPLVAFFAWTFGQFVIGHYPNDFLRQAGTLVPALIVGLLALSLLSGHACDVRRHDLAGA